MKIVLSDILKQALWENDLPVREIDPESFSIDPPKGNLIEIKRYEIDLPKIEFLANTGNKGNGNHGIDVYFHAGFDTKCQVIDDLDKVIYILHQGIELDGKIRLTLYGTVRRYYKGWREIVLKAEPILTEKKESKKSKSKKTEVKNGEDNINAGEAD